MEASPPRQEPEAEPQGRAPVLGIDLGTSFARVGVWHDGDVNIIQNERGAMSTPCWVAFTDSGILVGEKALEQVSSNVENTVYAPQRLLGFRTDNPWVQWHSRLWPSQVVHGEDDRPLFRITRKGEDQLFRPEELVAMILASLRKAAEKKTGRTVTDVCVTVPARYGKIQREAIIEACRIAGLRAVQLIKAPTAGAVAYSLTNRLRAERSTFVVCDMGSTYFDFVLLKCERGCLTERAFGTDYINFDKSLVQCCVADLKEKWGMSAMTDRVQLHRLQKACEVAKKHLSTYSRARVEIKELAPGVDYSCVLSRTHFEELVREDLRSILEPLGWCLEDCGLERWDICEVVLVGGSSHIPGLKKGITEFFYGLKPVEVLKPEHAAVLGAAAYAAAFDGRRAGDMPVELERLQLVEVLPWSELPGEGDEVASETATRRSSGRSGRSKPQPHAPHAAAAGGGRQPVLAPPQPRTRASFSELAQPLSLQGDQDMPRRSRDPSPDQAC